jgi:hypothetical protein
MQVRRPGEYARGRVDRTLVAAVIVLLLSIPLVLLLGLPAVWGPLLFIFVMVVWEREDVRTTRNWHKGAVGEEMVGRALAGLELAGFRALHDIDTGYGNIDHVIVGPTGVFALETKAWRGAVYCGRDGHLMAGTIDQERAIKQAKGAAMEVHGRLDKSGLGTWVEAVIVLTARDLPKGRIRRSDVTVIELADLPAFLAERPTKLGSLEIARARAAIFREGQDQETGAETRPLVRRDVARVRFDRT